MMFFFRPLTRGVRRTWRGTCTLILGGVGFVCFHHKRLGLAGLFLCILRKFIEAGSASGKAMTLEWSAQVNQLFRRCLVAFASAQSCFLKCKYCEDCRWPPGASTGVVHELHFEVQDLTRSLVAAEVAGYAFQVLEYRKSCHLSGAFLHAGSI
jgi:hypothetical protein